MPKKKKINISGIFSHIKAWHIAVVSLAFFMVIAYIAGKQVTAYTGELSKVKIYVSMVEQRLDIKINKDQIIDTKQRLDEIHDRYGNNPRDPYIQKRKKELEDTLIELEKEQERLFKKEAD